MHSVLIVDDESYVVSSLVSGVDWDRLGLCVTGTAENGAQALAKLEQSPADIVITDIRMPGMTGLELCQEIRRRHPATQLIVISGYADFAYAQRAIKYGVVGYCLKPVEFAELEGFLTQAVRKRQATAPTTYDDLLDTIETGSPADIRALLDRFGMEDAAFYVAVAVGEQGALREGVKLTVPLARDKELLLCAGSLPDAALHAALRDGRLRSVGICGDMVTAEGLPQALRSCILKAYQCFIDPRARVCRRLPSGKDTYYHNRLADAVAGASRGAVLQVLDEILACEYETIFTIQSALKLCNVVFASRMMSSEVDDTYLYSFDQLVREYDSFPAVIQAIRDALTEEADDGYSVENVSQRFLGVLRYINLHFDESITLRDVAEAEHLNANYISQMFRRESGSTFTQYLTDLRIGKAKKLLVTESIPVSDVAAQIGFNDYFYFLKFFKKVVGVTPTKYREQAWKEEA